MQNLPVLVISLMVLCPAVAGATECRTSGQGGLMAVAHLRMSSTVEITIRTPNGQLAHGAGVIWDDRGHIVTNDHVAMAGDAYTVRLIGRAPRSGRLVARAPERDLAVLMVDGPLPAPAPRANVTELRAGDSVVALGNPFGRGLSLATGVVNGFGREVITGPTTHLFGMLETTTPLVPGNSGGPLFDCGGRLVGINTAVFQRGNGRLGFAIPVDQVREVADTLLQAPLSVAQASPPATTAPTATSQQDRVPAASPIAVPQPTLPTVPRRPGLGLYVASGEAGHLIVQQVIGGSPAEVAGALPGDAILEANGRRVASPADLQQVVQQAGAGTITVLRIIRYGTPIDMAIRIAPVIFKS